ncbi:MAG: triphosphoribosyl-dephospho-CoA synthase, partial [Candidatus Binatia bacterium]
STSREHDVQAPATVGLRAAMAAAADRDRIATQYVTDFADIFGLGVPRLREALGRWPSESWAAASAYLGFLAGFSDTHIVRKHGAKRAADVRRRATPLNARLRNCADPAAMQEALLDFDATLKSEGMNPGTSADLTVASLFTRRLQDAMTADAGGPPRD